MTNPTITHQSNLLAQSEILHKHLCPRQVLGVRMGLQIAHLFHLNLPQADKRLFAFVETDGCFADGVSVATGCWFGRRTMRLVDYGKIAVTFIDTKTDNAIRIYPHPLARQHATEYRPNAQSRWHTMLEAYQVMPVDDLLCWQPVVMTVALKQIISRPGVRVNCSICGEEIINQREVLIDGVAYCQSCVGNSYYDVTSQGCCSDDEY